MLRAIFRIRPRLNNESDMLWQLFSSAVLRSVMSILALFAVCIAEISSMPSTEAKPIDKSPRSITLHFPAQAVGKIYEVALLKNGFMANPGGAAKTLTARGDVNVDPARAVMFVMNYAGSEHPDCLDQFRNTNLVILDMNNLENVNDETFSHLEMLTTLKRIRANSTDLSDKGLKFLKPLKALTMLTACGTLVKGPGLAYLSELPALYRLELARSAMRNFDFSHLPTLKTLVDLDLSGCVLNDTACIYLGRMRTVRLLNIAKNKISDAGIAHLTGMSRLAEINLIGTAVTPRAATSLSKLPALCKVVLGEDQFSELGLERFKKSLPRCVIEPRKSDGKIDANVFAPLR
jgi:hypothetical protein